MLLYNFLKKMNAGGSTMIQSNMLTSAKGAPPDEVAFTERNDRVDPPRYFKGVINNVGMIGEMVHDGIIRVDVMDAVPGNRPFSNIFPTSKSQKVHSLQQIQSSDSI